MAFLDKLIIAGGISYLLHKRASAKRQREMAEAEERRRKSKAVRFDEGITYADFCTMVRRACKRIKRVVDYDVSGSTVRGTAISQSGITEWDFTIDFNDYGHLTGNWWLTSENHDSMIPRKVADLISDQIEDALSDRT